MHPEGGTLAYLIRFTAIRFSRLRNELHRARDCRIGTGRRFGGCGSFSEGNSRLFWPAHASVAFSGARAAHTLGQFTAPFEASQQPSIDALHLSGGNQSSLPEDKGHYAQNILRRFR